LLTDIQGNTSLSRADRDSLAKLVQKLLKINPKLAKQKNQKNIYPLTLATEVGLRRVSGAIMPKSPQAALRQALTNCSQREIKKALREGLNRRSWSQSVIKVLSDVSGRFFRSGGDFMH